MQVALLNNKGLQAAYAELGDSAADAWQSTMLVNPTVELGLIGIGTPGLEAFKTVEGVIATNILALATHKRNVEIADTEFRKAQLAAALQTLQLAADTRRAWINAVSSWEMVAQLNQAQATADAASELAQKLGETGAMTKGGQAREHVFYAELAGQTAKARLEARLAKEELTRLMGLWGSDTDYQIPNRLAQLPKGLIKRDLIEAEALQRRVDLQMAKLDLEATAKSYNLTEATRYVTDLEILTGFETERELEDGEKKVDTTGNVALEFVIPIFDSGKARMRKGELAYMRSANLLAEKAVNVRSEARSAYQAYRSNYDIALHYRNSVVPLRTKIEEESLLTYNGMITNTFELLADSREKVTSILLAVNAKRDFWLAEANLAPAIYGGGAGTAGGGDGSRSGCRKRRRRSLGKDTDMFNRRQILGAGAALISTAAWAKTSNMGLPEAAVMETARHAAARAADLGTGLTPVVTLNGWTLPHRMNNGVKEFHLVAEPVEREMAEGMTAHLWGYNGQSPGPTIEAVEGDRVRIFVTNKLPEHTTIHWHGMILPSGMDGVGGLSQPHIPVGKTFVYEFDLVKSGTFMYHPHSDEMVQMAMGMMGMFIIHPKDEKFMPVDRDFVFLLSAYDIDPGTYVPRVMEMTDFNLWAWNSRIFPGISPLVVSKDDRVRVRVGNLTMTNHPIHMHGYDFEVTCTDGGWVRPEARWPEVSIDIPVGAMRAYEFDAKYVGDWAIHCHKSHHTMNAMGHDVPTFIGVDKRDVAAKIRKIQPEYMPMGTAGMADMGEMEMEIPENTVPMMTGWGPHGPIEMGGMFSVVKVREGITADDYTDPGWYENPPGTQAWEWTGELPDTTKAKDAKTQITPKPMKHG